MVEGGEEVHNVADTSAAAVVGSSGKLNAFVGAIFNVLIFWTVLYILRLIFLTVSGSLEKNNKGEVGGGTSRWSFRFGEIRFYTDQWNSIFYRLGGPNSYIHPILSTWFSTGVIVCLCGSVVSVLVLIANLFSLLRWFSSYAMQFLLFDSAHEQLLESDILTPLVSCGESMRVCFLTRAFSDFNLF